MVHPMCSQCNFERDSLVYYRYRIAYKRNTLYVFEMFFFQGFVPGMLGVSHGALQFMTYEEMKNKYNQYRNVPIDTKMVSSINCSILYSICHRTRKAPRN